MPVRPMLAAQKYRQPGDLWSPAHEAIVLGHLKEDGFLIVQPKWDGFRGVLDPETRQVMSRSWTPLANNYLQEFARTAPEEVHLADGEVFSGHAYHPEAFRESMSGIRAGNGATQITWVLYDYLKNPQAPYRDRRNELIDKVFNGAPERTFETATCTVRCLLCPQASVQTLEELYAEESRLLALGFEGAIVRRPHLPYKNGRSTALGGHLTKVKRRITVDARVTGFEQRYANQNELTTSALGYAKRSAHQEGKVPLDMLGALHLELLDGSGIKTKCGVFRGLSHEDLRALWQTRDRLPGSYCEVSMDPITGGYDSARTPVFLRWRDPSEF